MLFTVLSLIAKTTYADSLRDDMNYARFPLSS